MYIKNGNDDYNDVISDNDNDHDVVIRTTKATLI